MPLYIRDSSVDFLAEQVRAKMGVSTKTDAVRIALQREMDRQDASVSLRDRLGAVRAQARERLGAPIPGVDMKALMDDLWGEDDVR